MGVLVTIGGFIWGVITAVGAAISTLIGYISTTVGTWLASIGSSVVGGVTALTTKIASIISVSWSSISSFVGNIATSIKTASLNLYKTVGQYASYIGSQWKAFTEFIHLETLLKLHSVATIFSSSYRNMINNIYSQISKVSSKLGLGAHTINLLLRNARAIVLDTSTMLGRPYDIAEVQWLGDMSNFLKLMESRAELYKKHPEELMYDLDNLIISKAADAKASAMQTVFATIDNTVNTVTEIAMGIDKVNDDIKDLVSGLPESIRTKIEGYTLPITSKVDNFINNKYLPKVSEINDALSLVVDSQNTYTNKFNGLVERIKRPASYIKEIDSLPGQEKTEQENILGEIAGRSRARIFEPVKYEVIELEKHMQSVVELKEGIEEPNPWDVGESNITNPLPQTEQGKETTWFVGEY